MKAYRVVTDEPIGVAVGFKPSDELLAEIGAEIDELDVVKDDGSNGIPWHVGEGTEIEIRDVELEDGMKQGLMPLGMELEIWRSEEEMQASFEEE